jgi:small subunit ribosomal protein S21
MIRVEARTGEPMEKTLRRFKKRCEKEGLTKDIKKNLYYDKPSEKRRRESRKLEKRIAGEKLEAAAARNGTPLRPR